eukprot:8947690-Pyramimonas_sp.AAC.1
MDQAWYHEASWGRVGQAEMGARGTFQPKEYSVDEHASTDSEVTAEEHDTNSQVRKSPRRSMMQTHRFGSHRGGA